MGLVEGRPAAVEGGPFGFRILRRDAAGLGSARDQAVVAHERLLDGRRIVIWQE